MDAKPLLQRVADIEDAHSDLEKRFHILQETVSDLQAVLYGESGPARLGRAAGPSA